MQKIEIILKYFSDFTEEQLRQFNALENLYREWNEKINVISRKDIDGLYEKHVLHSLSIAAVFDFKENSQIADLGCGGGFPSIPLAIFFSRCTISFNRQCCKKIKSSRCRSANYRIKKYYNATFAY
jgi:16S rRNA (guanine527-N7)-methyltransferase